MIAQVVNVTRKPHGLDNAQDSPNTAFGLHFMTEKDKLLWLQFYCIKLHELAVAYKRAKFHL